MDILNCLVANWDSVLLVVAVIAVLVILVVRNEKEIIDQIIYRVVTELEKEYGGGTGSLKLAAAIDIVYPKLPAVLRAVISASTLRRWIEEGLTKAKEHWEKNTAISGYIES